jgi:hypothetical protein
VSRYRITLKDGTVVEVEADIVSLANADGQTVELDADSYDAVDIEAAGLAFRDDGG